MVVAASKSKMGGGLSVVGLVESGNFRKDWVVAWRFVEPRGNLLVGQKPEVVVSMVGHSAFGQTDSELVVAENKLRSGCCNEYQCSRADPDMRRNFTCSSVGRTWAVVLLRLN